MLSREKVIESAMFQDCLVHIEILSNIAHFVYMLPAGVKVYSLVDWFICRLAFRIQTGKSFSMYLDGRLTSRYTICHRLLDLKL